MHKKIELQPTAAAHWHALVSEAEQTTRCELGEEVESYLVFLLQRFLNKPEIGSRALAIDYLKGLLATGRRQHDRLREVGDICLLHAGLYPRRARRKRVSVSYFVDLGQGAYGQLHDSGRHALGRLYALLCERFVPAMDVLQAIRRLSEPGPGLDSLAAFDLWADTGSRQARDCLTRISDGTLIHDPTGHRH